MKTIALICIVLTGLLFSSVKATDDLSSARMIFYFGPQLNDNQSYELDLATQFLKHPKYDRNKKTVLYVHGYQENQDSESIKVIVMAYLKRTDYNLLVLDYAKLAEGNYLFSAVPNAIKLGDKMASVIITLFENGLNFVKFHLVGHSLGGQMVGQIGREIKKKTSQAVVIRRISALDPANPPFYANFFLEHISASDAQFVDVIHTDAFLYGAPVSTGTVDFWPNGGKTLQPGCPTRNYQPLTDNDLCSHRRSWWFWAESVENSGDQKFNAVKSSSWTDFKAGIAEPMELDVVMGIDCPKNATGNYYLQTNPGAPFARGEAGTKYETPTNVTQSNK